MLAALPKSVQLAVKALAEIFNAEDETHARAAAQAFQPDFGTKWPKAVATVNHRSRRAVDVCDYPAEH